jgi:hypothetical protein
MCATIQERIHAIGAHCDPNIPRINDKFIILQINFFHCVASIGCLIIPASCLCFSLCHHNNSDSLFANQCFKRGMTRKYQNTFLVLPFVLFLLQFSSSPASFLRLNQSSPQIGHFSRSPYSSPRYRMQSFLHAWIFSTSKPSGQIICFAS